MLCLAGSKDKIDSAMTGGEGIPSPELPLKASLEAGGLLSAARGCFITSLISSTFHSSGTGKATINSS